MMRDRRRHSLPPLTAIVLVAALGGCATGQSGAPGQRVTLSTPYEIVPASSPPREIRSKLGRLAKIDPDQPVTADSDTQTLSMFGREDLIAAASEDYAPSSCAPLAASMPVMDEIVRRARQTSIVIINESHERSRHRGFAAEVARQLRPLGYDTLAMETLENPEPGTPTQYLPPFLTQPDQPYLHDQDGYYLSESSYGGLGRQAKALGYRLLNYEDNTQNGPRRNPDPEKQIAIREDAQASNLAAFLQRHPGAKLLVYVGYSHASEVPRADGRRWMAARLKEKTGIDPLTIAQTVCRGGSDSMRFSTLPADLPAGTFDLIVDHPSERFTHGRPEWRLTAGDRIVTIPRQLRPAKGWRVIEARRPGEPTTSVPVDRVAIRPGEDVALMLPPGRYSLRAIDVGPAGSDD